MTIARMGIEITCSDPDLLDLIAGNYRAFLNRSEDNFHISIEAINRSGSLLDISRMISFQDRRICFSGPAIDGWIAEDLRQASLTFSSQHAFEIIDYFVRVVLAVMAFNAGGLMLHAAGIVRNGLAHLFLGHSGSGKTTVARLSKRDIVLNDDLIVVLPAHGGWEVHSTPFWNPTQIQPEPGFARLSGFFRLVQDKSVYLEPMKFVQAIAELITNIPVLPADPGRNQEVLNRAEVLLHEFPFYRLHFLPDASFWEVIRTR